MPVDDKKLADTKTTGSKGYTNADAQKARSMREKTPQTDTTPGDTVSYGDSAGKTGKYVIEAHPDHPSGGQRITHRRVQGK